MATEVGGEFLKEAWPIFLTQLGPGTGHVWPKSSPAQATGSGQCDAHLAAGETEAWRALIFTALLGVLQQLGGGAPEPRADTYMYILYCISDT